MDEWWLRVNTKPRTICWCTSDAADGILASLAAAIVQVRFQLLPLAGIVHAILRKYRNAPADFADACLFHMAD
jgi:hypothetical protein